MKSRNGREWPDGEAYETTTMARFGSGPYNDPLVELMK